MQPDQKRDHTTEAFRNICVLLRSLREDHCAYIRSQTQHVCGRFKDALGIQCLIHFGEAQLPDPERVSLSKAARLCGVSHRTIERLVEAGLLKREQVAPRAPWESF